MSEKVVFEPDGTYQRGERVEEMDVQAGKRPRRTLADVAKSAKSTRPAAVKQHPAPGSFDLSSLRASAQKAAGTAAKTTLPKQGAAKFSEVTTITSKDSGAAKKPDEENNNGKSPSPESTKKQEKEPISSPLTEETKPEVSKPAPTAVAVDGATQAPMTDTTDEPQVTVKEPNGDVAMQSVGTVTGDLPGEESVTAADAASEDTAPVKEVKLGEQPVVPQEETAPASIGKDFSGQGFKVVPLKQFLSELHLDEFTLAKWCRTCTTKAVSMPATIFSAAFNEDVRFYNFFQGKSVNWFGAVVGCGDSIVCVQIQVKSLVMQDAASMVTSDGDAVMLNGETVVLYEERLHTTRKV